MSESSLSDGPPPEATLEQALRHAVQNVYKSGDLEQLTVKRLRKAAEEDLDLQEGFFKQGAAWKEKSKAIIESEVESQAAVVASDDELSCSKSPNPKNSKRTPSKTTKLPKITKGQPSKTSTKRMSAEADNPKKRRRKSRQGDSDNGGRLVELSASGGGGIRKKPTMTRPKKGREQPETAVDSDAPDGEADKRKAGASDAGGAESESDMSVLLDEEIKAKTKRRNSSPSQPKSNQPSNSKSKKGSEQIQNPDAEEIKRLQGWLIKCGIRKMWHKELASCDGSNSKIRHLKGMLADAGMTGRYSADKANTIKEERELKADLEAVQEGAKHWGKVEAEEEANGKPKRRLARGLKELDFLNDDDGEETD